jgi:hypothetical protein
MANCVFMFRYRQIHNSSFVPDGERLNLAEGTAWYLNVNYPHSLDNAGKIDRIDLVFDCLVNDWLKAVIDKSAGTGTTDGSKATALPTASPAP